jgi:Ni,Fe-hydrogenase III large subunit/Ni,Fe-hydrogenase III component G
MKLIKKEIPLKLFHQSCRQWTDRGERRLGLLTSIDGAQVVCVMLDPPNGTAELWEVKLEENNYKALTLLLPQAHWFERVLFDMFGIVPEGHPRLKHVLLHEQYEPGFFPLRKVPLPAEFETDRRYKFLEVKGEGVYEIPVGPIHAGTIEPGHFRFSCLGETIVNLEIRMGWVHRGVEKRMTEVPWRKIRYVAEATASDTAAANVLAHAIAIESMFGVEVPLRAETLRTIAMEVERLAMHAIDVGGMASDVGFLPIYHNLSRLRAMALGMAQCLSGNRFLRGFIFPGGTRDLDDARLEKVKTLVKNMRAEIKPILDIFDDNQVVKQRLSFAAISKSLAFEFGLVGVAARGCGIPYDCRRFFKHGLYPGAAPEVAVQKDGDMLSRTRVRISEIYSSMDIIERLVGELVPGDVSVQLPDELPPNEISLGVVEAFRGELLHLVFTDENGKISRYAIKDPSANNWTAISIANRNGLIADFPLCNKSMSLSYSGNDL